MVFAGFIVATTLQADAVCALRTVLTRSERQRGLGVQNERSKDIIGKELIRLDKRFI
jgi:hypothetical protein